MPPAALSHNSCFSTAQLQKAQEENERLKQEKSENEKGRDKTKQARIPRPSGAVSAWKLQEAMQLTGSVEKSEMYAGIQVGALLSYRSKV